MMFKFIMSGLLSVGAATSALAFFTGVCNIHYLVSNVLAFMASTIVWYIFNKYWTFQNFQEAKHGFWISIAIRLVSLGANELLLAFLTAVCGIYYLGSSLLATALIFPMTYWMSKWLIWNSKITWGGGN